MKQAAPWVLTLIILISGIYIYLTLPTQNAVMPEFNVTPFPPVESIQMQTPKVELQEPVTIEDPTPFPWPTLVPEATEPQFAPLTGPYWCPYTDLWIESIDYSQLSSLSVLDSRIYLERILLSDGSAHFLGMPYESRMIGDIAYGFNPVCINSVTNFPPMNNLNGLGASQAGILNLQIRKIPMCAIDPVTGTGCSGTSLEVSLGNGLYAYPVHVPQMGLEEMPSGIGPDSQPQTVISTVISLDSWLEKTWAKGPNYSYKFYTSNDQLVVTFITQEGIGRNVNLLAIKPWWNNDKNTQILFGSCQKVPQGTEIPGRPGFCITGFNFH